MSGTGQSRAKGNRRKEGQPAFKGVLLHRRVPNVPIQGTDGDALHMFWVGNGILGSVLGTEGPFAVA